MYANLYECEGQESVCVLEYLIDLYPSIKMFNKCQYVHKILRLQRKIATLSSLHLIASLHFSSLHLIATLFFPSLNRYTFLPLTSLHFSSLHLIATFFFPSLNLFSSLHFATLFFQVTFSCTWTGALSWIGRD